MGFVFYSKVFPLGVFVKFVKALTKYIRWQFLIGRLKNKEVFVPNMAPVTISTETEFCDESAE